MLIRKPSFARVLQTHLRHFSLAPVHQDRHPPHHSSNTFRDSQNLTRNTQRQSMQFLGSIAERISVPKKEKRVASPALCSSKKMVNTEATKGLYPYTIIRSRSLLIKWVSRFFSQGCIILRFDPNLSQMRSLRKFGSCPDWYALCSFIFALCLFFELFIGKFELGFSYLLKLR